MTLVTAFPCAARPAGASNATLGSGTYTLEVRPGVVDTTIYYELVLDAR